MAPKRITAKFSGPKLRGTADRRETVTNDIGHNAWSSVFLRSNYFNCFVPRIK